MSETQYFEYHHQCSPIPLLICIKSYDISKRSIIYWKCRARTHTQNLLTFTMCFFFMRVILLFEIRKSDNVHSKQMIVLRQILIRKNSYRSYINDINILFVHWTQYLELKQSGNFNWLLMLIPWRHYHLCSSSYDEFQIMLLDVYTAIQNS